MTDAKETSPSVKTPYCPLCLKRMTMTYEEKRGFFVYACHLDRIAIRCTDPFVNKWDQAFAATGSKFECPHCNADMRYFCTSTGFVKAKCPKKSCGVSISNSEVETEKIQKNKEKLDPENPGLLH